MTSWLSPSNMNISSNLTANVTYNISVCDIEHDRVNASKAFVFVPELPLTKQEKIIYISIFSITIVMSLLLNIHLLQMLISAKIGVNRKTQQRPRTDNFIISLCASDLLVTLLVIPGNIYRIYNDYSWELCEDYKVNLWSCKISAYIQSVATLSSTFALTALSIERWVYLYVANILPFYQLIWGFFSIPEQEINKATLF